MTGPGATGKIEAVASKAKNGAGPKPEATMADLESAIKKIVVTSKAAAKKKAAAEKAAGKKK